MMDVLLECVCFLPSLVLAAALLGLFFRRGRRQRAIRPLGLAEGARIAVLSWPVLAVFGMMPFVLSGALPPLDAFFTAMAAVTSTGLSAFPEVLALPPALALWHGALYGLGGAAALVMLVTVLPQVGGCFGITLSARQTVYFSPIRRKMRQSAAQILCVYGGLLAVFFLVLLALGMAPMRAFVVVCATVSTAGSGLSGAFGGEGNGLLQAAATLMMLVAGGNFLLYFKAWARRSPGLLFRDTALRMEWKVALAASALVALHLSATGTYGLTDAVRQGVFHVVSFFTTAGFHEDAVAAWPDFDRSVLFLLACTGACIGSPAGGLKVVRILVLARLALGELRRTLHPRMIVSVRLDGLPVPDKVIGRILAFFFLFIAALTLGALALSATGVQVLPAFGLAAGCLTGAGSLAPLLGCPPAAALDPAAKVIACVLMVVGRAEIFAVFLLAAAGTEEARKKLA